MDENDGVVVELTVVEIDVDDAGLVEIDGESVGGLTVVKFDVGSMDIFP